MEPTVIQKDTHTHTPGFTEALFTIARTWKQPKCPSRCMDKEDAVHIYEGVLAIKKEQNNVICSNVDEFRDYHKWSKSDKDTYHMIALICGNYFLKNDLIYKTLNRLTDSKNKFMVTKGETWAGDKLRAWD